MNIQLTVPFFMVMDMTRSLRFYADELGFKLTKQWTPRGTIEWCWLDREAVSIMLQQPRQPNAEQKGLLGAGVTITYQCADALALYSEFTAKGVYMPEPFVGNNLWVVSVKDPDGYRLEFASPTEVAEGTTLSQWNKSHN